jgi:hypothetical protein
MNVIGKDTAQKLLNYCTHLQSKVLPRSADISCHPGTNDGFPVQGCREECDKADVKRPSRWVAIAFLDIRQNLTSVVHSRHSVESHHVTMARPIKENLLPGSARPDPSGSSSQFWTRFGRSLHLLPSLRHSSAGISPVHGSYTRSASASSRTLDIWPASLTGIGVTGPLRFYIRPVVVIFDLGTISLRRAAAGCPRHRLGEAGSISHSCSDVQARVSAGVSFSLTPPGFCS